MKTETALLLGTPGTHEPVRLESVPGSDGSLQERLVAIHTGATFPIRDGIPILLDQTKISGYNLQYQGIYNRVAGLYDPAIRLVGLMAGAGEGQFRQEFLRELDVRESDRLLEVSIGTGANFRFLAKKVAYFGLDLSWGMLKKCQKNLRKWRLHAELIMGNAEDLPLQDESFDAILHVGGINAFNDRAQAIIEMIRVAKPGSKIVIVDETAKLMESIRWMPSVRKWLEQAGDRFAAPVDLVPPGMLDVQVKEIARGNLYCLIFRKP